MPEGSRGRLGDLDFARAVLFSLGLVFHAAYLLEGHGAAFSNIVSVIHAFRMESFFLIAGFFAAGSLVRSNSSEFLRRRIVRLGVPLLFCAILLNGLVNLIAQPEVWADPKLLLRPRFWIRGSWHQAGHLWFLGTLIVYTVGTYAVHRIFPRFDEWVRRPECDLVQFLTIGATVYGLFSVASTAVPTPPWGNLWLFVNQQATLQHLPFFVAGYVLFHRRELFERLVRQPVVNFAGVGLYWIAVSSAGLLPLGAWLQASLQGLYIFSICGLLFWCARQGEWAEHRAVRSFAAAAYTVYLVHWPIMVVMQKLSERAGWPAFAVFSGLCLGAGAASIAVHHLFVVRYAWLSFLLNGALPREGRGRSGRIDREGRLPVPVETRKAASPGVASTVEEGQPPRGFKRKEQPASLARGH